MNRTGCKLVESVPCKVSGTPVLVGTRIPADAIAESVDAFMKIDGMCFDQAIAATAECFPGAGIARINALLEYRLAHELQLQA